jgi:hypothetical protein
MDIASAGGFRDFAERAGEARMNLAVVIAVLVGATTVAAAQTGLPEKPIKSSHVSRAARPLPVVIPQQFAPPQEAYASMPESAADAANAAPPSACQLGLQKLAVFKPLPVLVGPGECGATDAVLMDAIILPDQTKVAVIPAATLRCPMAEQVAQWVRDDVAPAVNAIGPPLRALDNFASYDCRGRNNIRAAQLSEHGRADALDVAGFRLADGRSLVLTDVNANKDWRERIKASVCARFSTVLGPGSDGYHEEHVHLDLEARRNNYKLCEWDVREPAVTAKDAAPQGDDAPSADDDAAPIPQAMVPLPRPRPMAANAAPSRFNRN